MSEFYSSSGNSSPFPMSSSDKAMDKYAAAKLNDRNWQRYSDTDVPIHSNIYFQDWNFANHSKWGVSIGCGEVGAKLKFTMIPCKINFEESMPNFIYSLNLEIRLTMDILGMLTRAVRPCLTSPSWDIWHQNSGLSPVKLCQQLWLGCVHFRETGHLRIITGSTPGTRRLLIWINHSLLQGCWYQV